MKMSKTSEWDNKICCICVKETEDLTSVLKFDPEGVKYSDKLRGCAPEQKWLDTFQICQKCLENLEEAYNFLQQCIKSEKLRHEFFQETVLKNIEQEGEEFKCPVCPQKFSRKSSVKRHVTIKHNERAANKRKRKLKNNAIEKEELDTITEEENNDMKDGIKKEEITLETNNIESENESDNETLSIIKNRIKTVKSDNDDEDYLPEAENLPSDPDDPDSFDDLPDFQKNEQYEVSAYNGGDYYCDFCPQTFTRKSSVKRHVLKQHSSPPSQKIELSAQDGIETTDDIKSESQEDPEPPPANKPYKIRKRRTLVKKVLPPKGPLKCTHCPKIFNRTDHWKIHIRNNHTFERPYACEQCPSKFTNSVALLMHKRNHKNERPFICDACGKSFVSSSHLANHKKTHQNKRSYRCEKCGKGFNMSGDLKKHNMIVHTDPSEWTHICNICQKRFPLKAGLDNHVKRHMGIRDCICHICSKNFVDINDLNKHIRTHSDDRTILPCNICKDKFFKTKDGLAKHLKSNHNIGNAVRVKKKYPCTLCNKVFSANYKLHKHVLTHASNGGSVPSWEDAVLPLFMPKSRILQPNPSYV